jgi:hypothetical protein
MNASIAVMDLFRRTGHLNADLHNSSTNTGVSNSRLLIYPVMELSRRDMISVETMEPYRYEVP